MKSTTKKQEGTGKKIFAAAIGNTLEWYDFSVFAFFAVYIGHTFFQDGDDSSVLIKSFLIFGVGFIARPLGAILLGLYGDLVGRKAALTMTIALMALGTAIIAFTPPIYMIGIGAPILLLVGRILQGFSAGGEIGGATAFLVENAPAEKRVIYGSILQASMGFSNILAAIVGVTVSSLFTNAEIQSWAWRIPFIIGLLIVPVGWYIRNTLDEPEEYKQAIAKERKPAKETLKELFTQYPKQLAAALMLSVLWTVCVYTLIIYMPSYYSSPVANLGFSRHDAFQAAFTGNIFLVLGSLFFGHLGDKFGMRNILIVGTLIMMVASYPLLIWLHHAPTFSHLVIVQICFCLMVSIIAGIMPTALTQMFPVAVRSTGMSLAYNAAAIVFAGFTPALMTWAIKTSVFAPSIHLAFASTVALVALIFMFKPQSYS